MRYRNYRGRMVPPPVEGKFMRDLISSSYSFYLPSCTAKRLEPVREAVDVTDLREYLMQTTRAGDCVAGLRNSHTLIIKCSKLTYVVDYKTLEVLYAEERSGDVL